MSASAGILLAGGLGRRMGGGDKCLQMLAGKTLLEHANERLRAQLALVLLNVNGDPQRFPPLGCRVLADAVPGHAGPLAGILAGLEFLQRHEPGITHLASVATDTPWFPLDFVSRCESAVGDDAAAIAIACSAGRSHPVFALWPVACAAALRRSLEAGQRRIDRFSANYHERRVDWAVEDRDPFFNINTAADLARAAELASEP